MSTAASPAAKVPAQDKFRTDKTVVGNVTLLSMRGTLNDAFEGKRLSDSIRTKKIVITLHDVQRFASWGMSEWMEFLRLNENNDVYLVECSTYAVSQLNLVSGLIGHAKLVSFYAAYRCGTCQAHSDSLFVVPRDRGIIRELPGSEYECNKCGGAVRLEEYPAAFFDTIADRPAFDIDDEVLAVLRTRFKYEITPDLTRFRAFRAVQGEHTYLRVSGSVERIAADKLADAVQGTTVIDLEGLVLDSYDVTAWRTFMQAALPKAKSMQLLHCPPNFLELAVTPTDLRDGVSVRTFVIPYSCLHCETTSAHRVDVAENLEQLVQAIAPPAHCSNCRAAQLAVLSPELTARMRALPARDRNSALEKFVTKARSLPADKLENVLLATAAKPAAAAASGKGQLYAVVALIVILLGGLTWFGLETWRQREERAGTPVATHSTDAGSAEPKFVRPEWIQIDLTSAGYCHDMINRLMCVGVSSYRPTRDEAVAEANDAALEELVHSIGLKISDPFFREHVATPVGEVRSNAVFALHSSESDRTGEAYINAHKHVRDARKRVVEALRASGGPAVPAQRSDWYWEEYAGINGGPNELLVFVRYDVTLDAVRMLVERYSTPTSVKGTTVLTAFPGLAWQYPALVGGAMVMAAPRSLTRAGVEVKKFIVAVEDAPITDATQLARRMEAAPPQVRLSITAGTEPPTVINARL